MRAHDRSTTLKERTSAAGAVTSWQGYLHLAWTGSDLHLNTIVSPDGRQFAGKQVLEHRTYTIDTVSDSSVLDGDRRTRTTAVPLSPALAATPAGVHLGWTGTDRQLNVSGPATGGHVVLPERSPDSLALSGMGDEIAVAWTGTDRHVNVVHGRGGEWGSPLRLDATSSHGPAVCAAGGDLVLAWTGTDRHVNVVHGRGGGWDRPHRLDATSSYGPALCRHLDAVALVWTGTDRRLNLAFLPIPG